MTTITALPAAPSRSQSSAAFITSADAFVAALPPMVTQVNAVAVEVNANATTCSAAATTATAAATAATAATGVTKWISGTTYAEGVNVWSPVTFQTFRRKTAGGGIIDPYLDTTNWAALIISVSQFQPSLALNNLAGVFN